MNTWLSINDANTMLFSKTPIVKWQHLVAFLVGRTYAWRQNLSYFMNGRNALYHALQALQLPKESTVLVPSFHCPAMIDPVLAGGVRIRYYSVLRDFSLDFREIASIADAGARALVFVHFLGFPAPVAELRQLAAQKNLALIEDCCHGLFGRIQGLPIGSFGDAAIFSFRKTVAVEDGGGLRINNPNYRFTFTGTAPITYHLRMAKWTLEKMKTGAVNHNPGFLRNPNHERTNTAAALKRSKGPDSHEDAEFVREWANWSISWPSKWLLSRVQPDQIREKRAQNYLTLHEHLRSNPLLQPCFPELPAGVCPLGYGFTTRFEKRLDYELRRHGIPAFSFGEELHPTLPVAKFPDTEFLSRHLTILPVHQDLNKADLAQMAQIVTAVVAKVDAAETGARKSSARHQNSDVSQ